ncbi:hypothetical protein Taro_028862 [Colocasia esculenta]|uniref:FLZ-type domain-containing protein n=1 Tax=Colocasia esculenta TaxID=4460 RepID=A0A843VIC8_COLES|nr:hypothetical protein [Colocasia esculenta]
MAEGKAVLRPPRTRRGTGYRALEGPLFSRRRYGGGVSVSCEPQRMEDPRHFLDACSLCGVTLRASRDIFMYRGDTPFCSEECRQEQIELDEAREGKTRARRQRWHHHAAHSPMKQAATPAVGQSLRAPPADAIIAS